MSILIPPQILTEEITQLQQSHTTTVAKIAECKRQLLLLSHRVLKVRKYCKEYHRYLHRTFVFFMVVVGGGGEPGIHQV